METNLKNQVSEKVAAFCQKQAATELKRRSGINATDISLLKNGKHARNNGSLIPEATYYTLANVLGLDLKHTALHWDTHYFLHLQKVCRKAHRGGEFIIVDGPSQMGKTYALRKYANTNQKAIHIIATHSMSTHDFLYEMLLKSGMQRDKIPYSERRRILALQDRLAHAGWLVIVDELEDVKPSVYRSVTEVAKFLEGVAGMIICGAGLYEQLEKLALRRKAPYWQLFERFSENNQLLGYRSETGDRKPVDPREIREIVKNHGFTDRTAQHWFSNIRNMKGLQTKVKIVLRYIQVSNQRDQPMAASQVTAEDLNRIFSIQ